MTPQLQGMREQSPRLGGPFRVDPDDQENQKDVWMDLDAADRQI